LWGGHCTPLQGSRANKPFLVTKPGGTTPPSPGRRVAAGLERRRRLTAGARHQLRAGARRQEATRTSHQGRRRRLLLRSRRGRRGLLWPPTPRRAAAGVRRPRSCFSPGHLPPPPSILRSPGRPGRGGAATQSPAPPQGGPGSRPLRSGPIQLGRADRCLLMFTRSAASPSRPGRNCQLDGPNIVTVGKARTRAHARAAADRVTAR
jgi:hypothetical protein